MLKVEDIFKKINSDYTFFSLSWHVMSCRVMLSLRTLRYVKLHNATSCQVTSRYVTLSHITSFDVILQLDLSLPFVGFGTSAEMYYDTTLQEAVSRGLKCHSNDLSKSCKLVRLIAKYLHEDYNSIFYGKAQNLGRELCKAYDAALQKYDVLILPTIPKKAPVFPQENPPMEGVVFITLLTNYS